MGPTMNAVVVGLVIFALLVAAAICANLGALCNGVHCANGEPHIVSTWESATCVCGGAP